MKKFFVMAVCVMACVMSVGTLCSCSGGDDDDGGLLSDGSKRVNFVLSHEVGPATTSSTGNAVRAITYTVSVAGIGDSDVEELRLFVSRNGGTFTESKGSGTRMSKSIGNYPSGCQVEYYAEMKPREGMTQQSKHNRFTVE